MHISQNVQSQPKSLKWLKSKTMRMVKIYWKGCTLKRLHYRIQCFSKKGMIQFSTLIIWWLIFEKKPFQFWRKIWIQVLVILLQLYLLLKFPYVPFDALPDPADDVVLWSWSWAELVVSVVSCRGRKSISVIPILLLWQGRRNLIKISLFQKFSSSQIQWRSDKKLWQFEFFVFLPEQNRSTVVSLDFFFERLLGFF